MDDDDTNVEPMFDYVGIDEGYNIDSLEDIGMIEFRNIRDEDVCHFHFSNVNITFEFYNRYAMTRGFSAQKNKTRKSRAGILKLKNFVCHREEFRPQNNYGIRNLKRKPTPETRCGCTAMMEIRIDAPSDYEIDVFRQKWFEIIERFGVENKNWVLDMYKKRHSWATAHIRGKFFAGFWTTSRCEGLNSIIAKYVNSRYNLVEFIQHFNRCVDHIRWKEVQADLASVNGRPEEDAAKKELVNDVDSVRDSVQVDASRAGLATNDLGHSMPRDPRK
ncbi:hypothetical protein Ahy_A07g035987 [Arachis hypogaea]|uniref:FAR1 domain-containing protein n=1 Tax=Arachis hypogaea TaxID=3818 RepID=A0A445CEY8_ARAHY|nr:hypothetical protein Ahy_A07g035987 [Arachis hypogaea]